MSMFFHFCFGESPLYLPLDRLFPVVASLSQTSFVSHV